jgi:hypothetical protein
MGDTPFNLMLGERHTKRLVDDFAAETYAQACARVNATAAEAVRTGYKEAVNMKSNVCEETNLLKVARTGTDAHTKLLESNTVCPPPTPMHVLIVYFRIL